MARHRLRKRYGRASGGSAFEVALHAYLARLNRQEADRNMRLTEGRVRPSTFSAMHGPVYVRIVRTDSANDRSAVGFVEIATGDIYVPNGWKGPRRNFPRGNIYRLSEND